MMSETILVPEKEITGTDPIQVNRSSLLKEVLKINFQPGKLLPAPPKEFPISKWNMPPEPEGYIKCHDNDCL
ncbi:MAG: hypothetical protein Q8941_22015 [Bacteroidota bacterium]|nr:hypothetical protein [Bacteroidota bacterium]